MRRKVEFWEVFLGGPSSELVGAFALGLLVVAILGNLLYDLLIGQPFTVWRLAAPAVAMLVGTGAAYGFYRRAVRPRSVDVIFDESRLAPPHAGLIWLLGPGRYEHLLFALQHHAKGGGGDHCWLVMQEVPPVQEAFGRLATDVAALETPVELHPCYIQELEAQAAYHAVREILTRGLQDVGLRPGDVVADITGGLKPLTAGMVLAALAVDAPLEYVETKRDADGNPIRGTEHVVLLDLDFAVSLAQPATTLPKEGGRTT
ncbi:MAG: hypothetical protein ACP5HS_12520 [Anaerolineae bacterium]